MRSIGLDVAPGADTQVIGSVADRRWSSASSREHGIEAVIHAGALHKPDIVRYPEQAFVDVNVAARCNLLEAAVAAGNDRFVFTSTTSLMISEAIRAGKAGGAGRAVWLDEDFAPLEPRNIYGATKLAAEQLCRAVHARARPAGHRPAHRPLLPRGGRHPSRPFRPEHQGQRVPQPPPDRRGCRRGACRRAGEGAGARLRAPSSSPRRRPSRREDARRWSTTRRR